MNYSSINMRNKLDLFSERWTPKVIAEMNDYQFKLVKIQGDFVWHKHDDTDEVFVCLRGRMHIDFRDGRVDLGEGELFVVPRGIEHRPHAAEECAVLLVEPKGVINTGAAASELTAPNDQWI